MSRITEYCNSWCFLKDSCDKDCPFYGVKNKIEDKGGIFLVDNDKNEYDIFSKIDISLDYEYVHVSKQPLLDLGCDYYVSLYELKRKDYYTGSWSNVYYNFDIELNDINGKDICKHICKKINFWDLRYDSDYFIGSVFQLDILLSYKKILTDIFKSKGIDLNFYKTNIWSANPYDVYRAYYWNSKSQNWARMNKVSSTARIIKFQSSI